MDVSSFLKKLKQQQQGSSDDVAHLPSPPPPTSAAEVFHNMSSSSSDDEEGSTNEPELAVRGGGGDRLRHKQSALFSKLAPSQDAAVEQSPLKLLASNSGTSAGLTTNSLRSGGRPIDAMRQRLHCHARTKRPRADTLDAIRSQLLQERNQLERTRQWDDTATLPPAPHPTDDDVARDVTPAAGTDMMDISRLLDESAQAVHVTLPDKPTSAPSVAVPDVSPVLRTGHELTPLPATDLERRVELQQSVPPAMSGSGTTTNDEAAPEEPAERPKKVSRFARAKQLVQEGGEAKTAPKQTLLYDQF